MSDQTIGTTTDDRECVPPPDQTVRLSDYDDDHLFTIDEIAMILRVSTFTVTGEINAGSLPCVRIGKVRRFVRAAVLRSYIRGELTAK